MAKKHQLEIYSLKCFTSVWSCVLLCTCVGFKNFEAAMSDIVNFCCIFTISHKFDDIFIVGESHCTILLTHALDVF